MKRWPDVSQREACHYCGRKLFAVDYARGLAEVRFELFDTMGGVGDREVHVHTYDCEKVSRRLTEVPK